jgi:hypothetical protein
MTVRPSDAWLRVFPGLRIPDVVQYVIVTWQWLQVTYADAVTFDHDEPTLTENLCEALNDPDRRFHSRMDCDFQVETRELRRNADGTTSYVARADIRVILGVPGTPHLVLEFKKLDGSTDARRLYCFDGLSRFVEGKYAIGHSHGIMCGFVCLDVAGEAVALAAYITDKERAGRLACISDAKGNAVRMPSAVDPVGASFDTCHARSSPEAPIVILHILVPCVQTALAGRQGLPQ